MTGVSPLPVVLLVDDDAVLRTEMSLYLASQGYEVLEAEDAAVARRHLAEGGVSVVVLDVNLPGEDGLSLCRSVTSQNGAIPILMLSAMGEPIDRILGLEIGADDYVVKPIPPRELLARIRALLRRAPPLSNPVRRASGYAFAGFRLDPVARQLKAPNDLTLVLTRAEVTILVELLEHPGGIVSRDDLARLNGSDDADSLSRAVDLHISRLRRKMHAQTEREILRTQRGMGYFIDAEVRPL